jgi:hypothetical protein
VRPRIHIQSIIDTLYVTPLRTKTRGRPRSSSRPAPDESRPTVRDEANMTIRQLMKGAF